MKQKYDPTNDIRFTLAKTSTKMFFVLVFVATALRPLVADLPLILTILGAINTALTGALFLVFKFARPRRYYLALLPICAYLCLLPLLVYSGGINSQFAVLIPLFPILTCLLTNICGAVLSACFNIFIVITMRIFNDAIQSLDIFEHHIELANARTFWLSLGSFLSLYFAMQFGKLSDRLSKTLNYQANTDSLTGILNRRSIIEQTTNSLALLAENNKNISVLMIDVDHFKSLNDKYGHLFGDECLKIIANCLQESIRDEYDYVGRYGGEEFLIMLNSANTDKAQEVAEKIRRSVEKTIFVNNQETIRVTITIGCCSEKARKVENIKTIIDVADKALYKGKEMGRNRVTCLPL